MVQITFVSAEGASTTIDAREGETLMMAATRNRVPGIVGECGGACACATCQVLVAPEWGDRASPVTAIERDMLPFAYDPQPTSRLSCQIKVTTALEGMVVEVPAEQYA